MKILIEIRHPAHTHLFKYFIREMAKHGHTIKVLAKEKDITTYLLDRYEISYTVIGQNRKGLLKKCKGMLIEDYKVYWLSRQFNPDIFVGRNSPSLAHISFIMKKPYLCFADTEHARLIWLATKPFISCIITPNCFMKYFGKKHVRYEGYHELAYLHRNYFRPDHSILEELSVSRDDKYVILRFVSWNASHDVGHSGLSLDMKRKAVRELSKYAKVFISSEGGLPEDLNQYQIKIPPEKMHDALAFATLFVGEGATMASECAMLSTPAIYVNSLTSGTLQEQENYGLLFGFRNSKGVLEKAQELLLIPNLKKEWQKRRQKLLSDKIDVTAFMIWFVENYPDSTKIMRENPDYQYNFK